MPKKPQKPASRKKKATPKPARAAARPNARATPKPWEPNAKQRAVIKMLEKRPFIRPACEQVGCSAGDFYQAMKHHPEFEQMVRDAQALGFERAEHEAMRRATEGVEEYVVAGGKIVMQTHDDDGNELAVPKPLKRQVYSDNLLTTILRGNVEKYGKQRFEHSGPNGQPIKSEKTVRLTDEQVDLIPTEILEKIAEQGGQT